MIRDFGEKIDGAAKDRWRGYLDRMRMVPETGIGAAPLSQSFPEPNYKALIREGVDPLIVDFVRATRDRIPPKPKYGLATWVATVSVSRDLCRDLIEDEALAASLISGINGKGWHQIQPHLQQIAGPMRLYKALGHEESLKGLDLVQSSYSMLGGIRYDPPIAQWEVTHKKPNKGRIVLCRGDSPESVIEALREKLATMKEPAAVTRKSGFELYRRESSGDTVIIGRKIGKTMVDLASFPTITEARKHLRDNLDTLVEQVARLRQVQNERGLENRERTGPDRRAGRDVTPDAFLEAFGFRGVQFGNYVEKWRRQADLNDAFDALHDLAGAIGCPPAALSLNGTLGLAFGARGSGGVNAATAHYEPIEIVMNLTKKKGAGSLAHEWFHALDNHIGRKLYGPLAYATESKGSLPPSLDHSDARAAAALRDVARAIGASGMPGRSGNIDQLRSTPYWGTMREMAARAFETFVIDRLAARGVTNDYLANVLEEEVYEAEARLMGLPAGRYPYPVAGEMGRLSDAFARLIVPRNPAMERPDAHAIEPGQAPESLAPPARPVPRSLPEEPVSPAPPADDPFEDIQWS